VNRLRRWGLPLLPVVGPVVLFGPAVVSGRLLAPGDGSWYFLPLYGLAARIWESGAVPVWNQYAFSGSPLLAVGGAGVFYPPNLAFLLLPDFTAYNLLVVLNFALAGTGAFLLARRLCHDDVAAAVAGIAFGLSGFMFGHLAHSSMSAAAAWLPWAFLGFELLRTRVTPARLTLAAGALAFTALAGHFQVFAIAAFAIGLYALTLVALEWRIARARPFLLLLGVLVVAVGLAAVQLVPTAAILGDTLRSSQSYEQATSYSFSLSHLPLLLFPYLFGNQVAASPFDAPYTGDWNLTELAGYPGLAVLVLAVAGLGAAGRDKRVVALAVTGALALVIALGGTTPIGRLVHALPIYGDIRAWARYALVIDLVVALLAAYGVALMRSGAPAARRAACIRACVAAGALVVAAVVLPQLPGVADHVADGRAGTLAVVVPALAAVTAAGCCVLAIRRAGIAAVAICSVALLDPILSFGGFFDWRHPPPFELARTAFSPATPAPWGRLRDASGGIDRYVIVDSNFTHETDLKEIGSLNGYDPLAPRDYAQAVGRMNYLGEIASPADVLRPSGHVLDLLRATVVVEPAAGGSTRGRERSPRLPEAFLVGATRRVSRTEALAAIHGRTPGFDPAAVALVEEDCAECADLTRPGRAGRVLSTHWGHGEVEVEVAADRPALLSVSQAWFPGWEATVDGSRASVLRADALLTAVPIPAGRHQVRLTYHAPGLRLGGAISVATLVLLLAGIVVGRRRREST
jgi:hypothetical protein